MLLFSSLLVGIRNFMGSEDINGDGVVNIVDLVLVAREFGSSCVAGTNNSQVSTLGTNNNETLRQAQGVKEKKTFTFVSILKSIFWVGL